MTGKELSQLFYLNREIEQDKMRLMELENAATSSSARITGLPHGTGLANKTALAADIADLKKEIELKTELCVVEFNRLMRYINGVGDSLMRQILTFRHVNGLNWAQVAAHIGGGNSEDGVRMAHKRFLLKNQK